MFWRKKTQAEPDTQKEIQKEAPKKSCLRKFFGFFFKTLKYISLLFLVCLLCLFGFIFWITQTESGQAWLVKTANSFIEQPQGSETPGYKITSLSGSIPANFTFGIEASDKHGIWLKAPANSFVWDWRSLPGAIHIQAISAENVDVERLPEFPPSPPSPPSKPMTLADIQKILAEAADFLAKEHWWLPQIRVDEISAPDVLLPASLLPAANNIEQRLALTAKADLAVIDSHATINFHTAAKNALAETLSLPSATIENLEANLKAEAGPAKDGLQSQISLATNIKKPLLEVGQLPADFLGENTALSLNVGATATTSGSRPGVAIAIAGPNLSAGHVNMDGGGQWATDSTWADGAIAGPLAYKLNFGLEPLDPGIESPLNALKSPFKGNLDINGLLPTLNLLLKLSCADIEKSGHTLADTNLAITAKNVELPLNAVDIHALEKENHINIDLSSLVDKHKVSLTTEAFFQALAANSADDAKGWRVGLRDLVLNALGLQGTGAVAVLLPEGKKPGLDGNIRLEVKDWKDISTFMPGQTFSGDVLLNAQLDSGANMAPAAQLFVPANTPFRQRADIKLAIPAFAMKSKDSAIILANVNIDASLDDVFASPAINAKVDAGKINAAGLNLSASAKASGPFAGPLKAAVSTKGSINSDIAAQWQPGKAEIDTLQVTADLTNFMLPGKGKKLLAGIRSTQQAQISYGDHGIEARNLDLRLLPSGHIKANGKLAPDKLDFKLDLADFELKPLQIISASIPSGAISLNANLSGSPQRPAGQFQLNLKNITIPQNPLPPLSLGLNGKLEHGNNGKSQLKTQLEIDPKTVKALGGNVAKITASLPLLFGPDGVPKPDMQGPLSARVNWDGALGPIWNLLPMADQRVNGRVLVNLGAGGTLSKPKITGKASINKARYENILYGVLLTDINLNVDLQDTGKSAIAGLPGGMKMNLSISDGRGGSVTANGQGALDGSNLDLKVKINRLQPLRRRDAHIELSGHTEISGPAASPQITGEIIVDKGEILLDNLEIASSSVTTLTITDPAELAKADAKKSKNSRKTSRKDKNIKKSAATAKRDKARTVEQAAAAAKNAPNNNFNLKFTMLPRFRVEGRGLGSVWKANLLITGPLADPKISGNISCARGNFDFLGKNFALTRGIVFFGGGSLANPLIDIDLTNETPDLTAHILITGPVSKIKLELTSDPVVPRDEILSRVLFGRSVNDLSRAEALQLAGAVAQLAGFGGGGGLLGSAKKALGVDVLRIGTSDTGDTGDNDAGGTNLEMGKYINDYIYMGVQQGLKPDSTAFIIEIEITPRLNLELRTEQNNTWGGVKWRYNY